MNRHFLLTVLMGVATLGIAPTAYAQTASSQSLTAPGVPRAVSAPTALSPYFAPGISLGVLSPPGEAEKFLKQKCDPHTIPIGLSTAPPLKVGPNKIGVINAGAKTLTFAVKLGETYQIVKLAPDEIETVTLLVGATALAGTSDNSIPTQTLTGGTVYRLKAQDGKWAFVAD